MVRWLGLIHMWLGGWWVGRTGFGSSQQTVFREWRSKW